MAIRILMPALSPTMTEGTLAKWLKNEGDAVASGDVIAEIETDKATMEVEAADEGTMGKIVVPGGSEGVPVNSLIAVLLEEGEDASALDAAIQSAPTLSSSPVAAPAAAPSPAPASAPSPAPVTGSGAKASPLARRLAQEGGIDLSRVTGSGPHGRIVKRDLEGAATAASPPLTGGRVFASPLARKLAREKGVDLSRLQGSGPQGRIVKLDVLAAPTGGGIPAAPVAVSVPADGRSFREVPNSTMRKVIASRLQESKQNIPHFYLTVDCEIDNLLDMRKRLNDEAPTEGEGAYKLSVNDIIVKAVGVALSQVPAANASWTETAIRLYDNVDVAVAVAAPGGLITPVVRDADKKGLAAISNEVKELAGRAREGKLAPEEYQGGGFTISNLGMYGIKEFSAIINPPQSCILAVGAGEQRPVVKHGALAIASVMTCTLSVDHRSVDGAVGAEFMAAFKRIIEEPLTMLL
ncbi:MAG: 2-oxo acid dehydrogenase subunit E2 [Rhodospirillales bacterium]|nr:2-oxo acid dehydrogenase subunit E2 [Rhodospirillales bacterium]